MFNRLYIHVPFCSEKCQYCAFISRTPQNDELVEYPALLSQELRLNSHNARLLKSIYFGGGTPSLLKPEQLGRLLTEIAEQIGIHEEAEITLEANPGTVTPVSLKTFYDVGFNRISLGVQSFDDRFLTSLGRIHTAEQSRQTFHAARQAGFKNISVDLIHTLPEQNIEQWRLELLHALDLCPEHISIYGLTVEEGTPFARIYPPGSAQLPDDDISADMFELADELLTAAGFEHYEIANYARSGYLSQHNSGYWKRDGYLGLGVAAHSFLHEGHGVRFCNPETLDEYRHGVTTGNAKRINEQRLTREDELSEYMFLGLRLSEGINFSAFEQRFSRSLESVYGTVTTELVKRGLLTQDAHAVRLTLRGMLLSNQVFSRFL
ncbi:MAG: radical SAM family heme chaperone HemW [Desulfuromonadaceae bacterium]|nr:radical SAM family heme chaperone HemW [Desulfuromonadaceae bacterium]